MATRPSSLTTYDRATPAERQRIRAAVLLVPCVFPNCLAAVGEPCRSNGKPAKPHIYRQNDANLK